MVWKRSPFPGVSMATEVCVAFHLDADGFLSSWIQTVGVVAGAGMGVSGRGPGLA